MDKFTKTERSRIMACVKSNYNKSTELKFLSFLRANKIVGWRRKYPIIGKPDFVFPKLKIAIFIDGCFWHGCSQHCRMPNSNELYWEKKIANNIKRDKKITKLLKEKGWQVIRIWEHELGSKNLLKKLNAIIILNKQEKNIKIKNNLSNKKETE